MNAGSEGSEEKGVIKERTRVIGGYWKEGGGGRTGERTGGRK